MKIVILHQHFRFPGQGGAIRSYYLAKALVEAGHEVIVISGGNSHRKITEEGIAVRYVSVDYDNRFGFFARVWSFGKYMWLAGRAARQEKGVNYFYAISVPLTVGITAMWLKRRTGVPFLFEVGDLWPEAPIQLGFVKNPWLQKFLYWMEKRIYQEADSIVALSPAIQKDIRAKVSNKKVHLIFNMADTDCYQPEPRTEELATAWDLQEKFVISYIGAIGFANGLDFLLDCAAHCKGQEHIRFVLAGEGAMLHHLKKRKENEGLTNVMFLPFGNRESVQKIMRVTDACFISYLPVPVLETGSPNKYFDALAAGKLILINFGGWIRTEIEDKGCGVYVDGRDPSTFLTKVLPYLNQPELLHRAQAAARQLAEEKYSRHKMSEAFQAIFK